MGLGKSKSRVTEHDKAVLVSQLFRSCFYEEFFAAVVSFRFSLPASEVTTGPSQAVPAASRGDNGERKTNGQEIDPRRKKRVKKDS